MIHRLFVYVTAFVAVAGTVWGLAFINEKMTVRYQAVGFVVDSAGKPLEGVEVVLSLAPPPSAGPQLDALFSAEGLNHGRNGAEGVLKRSIGPAVGLSSATGAYIVRAVGRTGPSHAIRLGLDNSGRPAFEVGWVVYRKQGYPDLTKTVSIMGWRTAPKDWGAFANRLPQIVMGE